MDALKCDSGPFAFYGAAVFGFTRTLFRCYHTSCPRTLKTSEPSQTLLWILLWQHLFNPCEERGSFCVCVSFFCVCLLCVCAFIWKYLCLPVAHNMCLCASHLVSSRASCVCMMASSPLGACPLALYLPPPVLAFLCAFALNPPLPPSRVSQLANMIHDVSGCQEQVG